MIYTDENTELRSIISDLNQQAIGYVDRIAALEAAQRWIPVSERLPTDDMVDIYEVVCRDIHTKRRYEDEIYWQMSFWEVPDSVVIEYWREIPPLPKPLEDSSGREIAAGGENG